MSILYKIYNILGEATPPIVFKKKQKSHLQHFIINKMYDKSIVNLMKETNKNTPTVTINSKDAKNIIEILTYIRSFIIEL